MSRSVVTYACPVCNASPMVAHTSVYGPFLGCTRYSQAGCRGKREVDGTPITHPPKPLPPPLPVRSPAPIPAPMSPVSSTTGRPDHTPGERSLLRRLYDAVTRRPRRTFSFIVGFVSLLASFPSIYSCVSSPTQPLAGAPSPPPSPPPRPAKSDHPFPATGKQPDQQVKLPSAPSTPLREVPLCPQCNQPMVIRHNRATKEPFYGCSDFPRCRGTSRYIGPRDTGD